MRKLAIIPLALIMLNCSGSKSLQESLKSQNPELSCPEDGECTITVEHNKSIATKTDDTGSLYYSTADHKGTDVVIYRYTKQHDPMLADAGLTEEVIFEIDSNSKSLEYKDKAIKQTNMLYHVACFCKGRAGYYKVESGELTYKDNKLNIQLPEILKPQKLKDITITLK
ncbi:hypothetical protein GCM10007424_19000 [Flavobacterium suaedae]|uniref:Lipoprotein n=1 Tax=Flavobacterium suaedae TaxID=1767027 RepID=A0ABQ1JY89_9FLAO|nr:hypothetical protein [Flavobacterium suaedae]GGB79021.1 hypothetical protein GCM10007424_19000 [Flavobacterium suaedae]